MNKTTRIMAAVFGGVCGAAIMATQPVEAFHFDEYTGAHAELVNVLQLADVPTIINPKLCDQMPGTYGFTNGYAVGICATRAPSQADIEDTLRHEAIHVAQSCVADAVPGSDPDGDGFAVLAPELEDAYWERHGETIALVYSPADWDVEAEAFTLAEDLTAAQVADIIKTACF